jgi:DNA primase
MAGTIASSTLEQIRAVSDIVEVIGNVVPLKRAGANFTALCPFHKEKTPSFTVTPAKQIFYCFGCHKGGDVFRFVQDYENISFMEAVRRLAERANIRLDFAKGEGDQQRQFLKETLLQIHEQITQRWQQALNQDAAGQVARDYLAQRQVPPEAIAVFRLGYAPEAWDDTVNWAKTKGFDLSLMEQAGLVGHKEDTGHYYDRFRGRLMFPICDEQGRVIAFSGRVLNPEAPGGKYVNSTETPIFTKGKVFFGLDKTKRSILEAQFAIVCEGQLDLIRCFTAGVRNIVAPQGTALTADHTRILKRYVSEVVLCFDSDVAGQKAADRSLDSLLASGLAIRVAVIPAPHDPDSFIRAQGAEAFQKLIANAEGFFDYYLNRCCQQHNPATDRGRMTITRLMAEAVQKTNNAVLVDTYAQKTALRLATAPDAVRAEFRRTSTAAFVPAGTEEESPTEAVEEPPPLEFWFLRLLFIDDSLVESAADRLDLAWLQHPVVRELVSQRINAWREKTWGGVASFLGQLEIPAIRNLVAKAVAEDRPIPNREQQVLDLIQRLHIQALDRDLAGLSRQIADPALTDERRMELMQQQNQLRMEKRSVRQGTAPA